MPLYNAEFSLGQGTLLREYLFRYPAHADIMEEPAEGDIEHRIAFIAHRPCQGCAENRHAGRMLG